MSLEAPLILELLVDTLKGENADVDVSILNLELVSHQTEPSPHMRIRFTMHFTPPECIVISEWVKVACIRDFDLFIAHVTRMNKGIPATISTPEGFPTNTRVVDVLCARSWKCDSDTLKMVPTCSVCLDDFEIGDRVVNLPCDPRHCGHERCVIRWLQEKASCPVCRDRLPSQVEPCSRRYTKMVAGRCVAPRLLKIKESSDLLSAFVTSNRFVLEAERYMPLVDFKKLYTKFRRASGYDGIRWTSQHYDAVFCEEGIHLKFMQRTYRGASKTRWYMLGIDLNEMEDH